VNSIENVAQVVDKNIIVLERHFPIPPERLWQSVATREGLSHWFMSTPQQIEQGGRFSFKGGWQGTVTLLDPPRHIQFTPDASAEAYLRFEIKAESGGCLFRLIDKMGPAADARTIFSVRAPKNMVYQPGGIGTHWSGIIAGHHGFVDSLDAYISGRSIPCDMEDLRTRYMAVLDQWHRLESSGPPEK
jgi:uncharacterized protein YndB with AHSA1/START domain